MKINPEARARALRRLRQDIAAAKAITIRRFGDESRFLTALARIGAGVLLHEGDLFSSYTPPARRRKRKGKR